MPRASLSASDRLLVKLTTMSENDLVSIRNIATALLAERRKSAPAVRKSAKKRAKKIAAPPVT